MTLDQVMALEGEPLDELVALRLGRCPHPFNALVKWEIEDGNDYDSGFRCTRCGKGDIYGDFCPKYSTVWNDAMIVQKWAANLTVDLRYDFAMVLWQVMRARLGDSVPMLMVLDSEPADYCRAALLLGEVVV